ncbi:sugar transferase [Piscicoccus intestinalis]|uniref:sugar transferase n=1 Tax=Piscicoccus intestinalis TaxID=746033 RepID=UPI000839218F|nr:sugar transferase [Piscicoccus intestinalis]
MPALDEVHSTGRSAGYRTWHSRYLRRLVPCDVLTALVAGAAGLATQLENVMPALGLYMLGVPAVVVVWVGALAMADAYGSRCLAVGSYQLRAVARATITLLAAVAIVAFLSNIGLSRIYLFTVMSLLVVGSLVARLVLVHWLHSNRRQGRLMQRTVVVGRADSVAALIQSVSMEPTQGLLPVAACATDVNGGEVRSHEIAGVPVVGPPRLAIEAVDVSDAEVVAVASHPDLAGPALRRLTWALEERGVELIVAPGLLDVAGPRLSIRPSQNLSLLHVERPAAARTHVISKSVMDLCFAAVLVLLLSPVLLAIALAVKLGDGGPVFFRQQRVGVSGEYFAMLKFRTMVVDAEAHLARLASRSDGNTVLFKMKDDPRVTKVGRVLRRYSLDELPQLFNVLKGDMSLVGPRPPLPREVDQYEPDARRRLRVKPGMTGLWQVSGRSDLSWEESLRLDLHYVDNWSPIGDLHILFRTVNAVVNGPGAY